MLGAPLNIPKWYVSPNDGLSLLPPFDVAARLEEHSHLLKPPINNYCVYNKDVTVMASSPP